MSKFMCAQVFTMLKGMVPTPLHRIGRVIICTSKGTAVNSTHYILPINFIFKLDLLSFESVAGRIFKIANIAPSSIK